MKLTRGLEQRTLRLVSSLPFVQGPRVCVHPYVHACETETNDDKISAPTQRNTPLCARSDPPPPLPAVAIRRMFRVHLALAHTRPTTQHTTRPHTEAQRKHVPERKKTHVMHSRSVYRKKARRHPSEDDRGGESHRQFPPLSVTA
jgi:hypothetical protein